jgi:Flp pilus assembly protein TadB
MSEYDRYEGAVTGLILPVSGLRRTATVVPGALCWRLRHAGRVTLLLPLVLVGPLLMLATAVVALAGHGPLGWLAAVLLVVAVAVVLRWTIARCRRWWRSTKAPERVTSTRRS